MSEMNKILESDQSDQLENENSNDSHSRDSLNKNISSSSKLNLCRDSDDLFEDNQENDSNNKVFLYVI
jgi:hypothetical protein